MSLLDSELAKRVPQTTSLGSNTRRHTKLPAININPFTGKYSEYITFRELFKSLIDCDTTLDDIQKLHYLRSFLKGEAYDIIKCLPLVGVSYREAINLLEERYNNEYKIVDEHIASLLDLSPISKPSPSNIRPFVSSVKQTLAALRNLGAKVDEWDPILMCIFSRKLDAQTSHDYQLERDTKVSPTVTHFLAYLEKAALALENAAVTSTTSKAQLRSAVVNVAASWSPPAHTECLYCKSGKHKLFACEKYKVLPSQDRVKFAKECKLCNVCLNSHRGKCRFHFKCGICKQGHNTLLHEDSSPISLISNVPITNMLLPTVKVKLFSRGGQEVHIKAILDSASHVSLVTKKVVDILGLTPARDSTNIVGVGNNNNVASYSVPLEISSVTTDYKVALNCHVLDKITCKLPQHPIDVSSIKIPLHAKLADPDFGTPSEINMLIGADVFFRSLLPAEASDEHLHASESIRPEVTNRDLPSIINTRFGHIVGGSLPSQHEVTNIISLLCVKCHDNIDASISKFWECEKVPEIFKESVPEHEIAEANFQATVQLVDNKFQVDLPLKVPLHEVNATLGDSFDLAYYRFLNLENKLIKNPNMLTEYQKFIHQYIDLGHAHFINFESLNFQKDLRSHHAVINEESKTTRTRVVFDGSMKTKNKMSLNDILLNGPIVQRQLFDIILLYRLGDYTLNSDITKMFRCINVNPKHTLLQNILWRDNPREDIKAIRLDTVTYGLKCSSYLATRCLLELINLHGADYPLASFIIKNCVYVDDVLYSHSDLSTLQEAKAQLTALLGLAGFELHKWSSNCPEVLSDIPMNKRQLDIIELSEGKHNIKALGLAVDIERDCFIIKCPDDFAAPPKTKRQILSQIARIYDPLGFISPIVVKAKAIMQRLWCEKIGWDASPPQQLLDEWDEFSNSLAAMEPIYLSRNIQVSEDDEVQLIGFADASSNTGYGACLYLRVVKASGEVVVSLLCSKSRINPCSKILTIPKLELNACVLLAKLASKVYDTLKLKLNIGAVYLYSDSQIVLSWIGADIIKLQAYAANRVKLIHELTRTWQWGYVDTKDNPADLVSRGAQPIPLAASQLWWLGPRYLQDDTYRFNEYVPKANAIAVINADSDVSSIKEQQNILE